MKKWESAWIIKDDRALFCLFLDFHFTFLRIKFRSFVAEF
jgi:hypothetical protein